MQQENLERYIIIPPSVMPTEKSRKLAHRLNALGSLFYFIKIVLQKKRFTNHLHKDMCRIVEADHLREVIEIPRGCFKSTTYSEGTPMWWGLPFNDSDEAAFRKLGYGDEFIRFMKRVHDQNTRTLLISENLTNAVKLGSKIGWHYENNDFFKELFPQIIPDSSCTWKQDSLEHKRTAKSPDGEGTYDFIGVGGAAQSRHYMRKIQDDLVGRDALDSDVVMADTINYHRLLPGLDDRAGRFVAPDGTMYANDEIVVGNRWSYKDLNQWIKENEPWYTFHTHSILGGCCEKHPVGKIIFPEEFTQEILRQECITYGLYYYSCQYLNQPIPPETCRFDKSWLRYFSIEPFTNKDRRGVIRHEVTDGEVLKDTFLSDLKYVMIVDPNHSGNHGRCNHAITVHAIQEKPTFKWYLVDCWAKSCGYEEFVREIFQRVHFWKLQEFWLETVAAQKYLKLYIDLVKKASIVRDIQTNSNVYSDYVKRCTVKELKIDYSPNAKERRIEALNPFFGERRVWVRRTHAETAKFISEYEQYPSGKLRDILDTVAYLPQVMNERIQGRSQDKQVKDFLDKRYQEYLHTAVNYSMA